MTPGPPTPYRLGPNGTRSANDGQSVLAADTQTQVAAKTPRKSLLCSLVNETKEFFRFIVSDLQARSTRDPRRQRLTGRPVDREAGSTLVLHQMNKEERR